MHIPVCPSRQRLADPFGAATEPGKTPLSSGVVDITKTARPAPAGVEKKRKAERPALPVFDNTVWRILERDCGDSLRYLDEVIERPGAPTTQTTRWTHAVETMLKSHVEGPGLPWQDISLSLTKDLTQRDAHSVKILLNASTADIDISCAKHSRQEPFLF